MATFEFPDCLQFDVIIQMGTPALESRDQCAIAICPVKTRTLRTVHLAGHDDVEIADLPLHDAEEFPVGLVRC